MLDQMLGLLWVGILNFVKLAVSIIKVTAVGDCIPLMKGELKVFACQN